MFVLYFVPYSLMVGKLGSAFKSQGGGVSSWLYETLGPKFAYYAGWTYWACHKHILQVKAVADLRLLAGRYSEMLKLMTVFRLYMYR